MTIAEQLPRLPDHWCPSIVPRYSRVAPVGAWITSDPPDVQRHRGFRRLAAAALLAWTGLIAVRHRRTPLEWFMPSLDRQLVAKLPAGPAAGR